MVGGSLRCCHLLVGSPVDGPGGGVGCEAPEEEQQEAEEGWVGGEEANLLQCALSCDELLNDGCQEASHCQAAHPQLQATKTRLQGKLPH